MFATLGEVQGGLVSTVKWPEDALELAAALRVYDAFRISEWFAINAIAILVNPVPVDAKNSEELVVRNVTYLPTMLAPHCLVSQGYTPQQFWELTLPGFEQRLLLSICKT
jgi:hypothetical protein